MVGHVGVRGALQKVYEGSGCERLIDSESRAIIESLADPCQKARLCAPPPFFATFMSCVHVCEEAQFSSSCSSCALNPPTAESSPFLVISSSRFGAFLWGVPIFSVTCCGFTAILQRRHECVGLCDVGGGDPFVKSACERGLCALLWTPRVRL